jgi:2-succinyl-5-enolpyruvyl-6-hydroxy-3-cyclohexene-1-carboxylate synthase
MVPANHVLYVASSMPVRDFDMFADDSGNAPWVGANRGASGIDGTVASAVGAARSVEQRATIVCGDLALLHDLNSLALLKDRRDTVVVFNNDGGGIFSFLPIAEHGDIFETWFATPHGFTFESAARMFGLRYSVPQTMGALSQSYDEALSSSQSTLIEVRTERSENINLHHDLDRRIAALY